MEFEELQQVWDDQDKRPIYTIDQQALRDRILRKKRQARHITNRNELVLIIVNAGAGIFILSMHFSVSKQFFMYLLAFWMLCTALLVTVSRFRRLKRNNRFDRSMRGDLDQAIATAAYQVRLSFFMRLNGLLLGLLVVLGLIESHKLAWITVAAVIFFVIGFYVSGFEHRFYLRKKRELQLLQSELERGG